MCYYYLRVLCGYGGTGRRDRLRIYCQRRGGSSPLSRTIQEVIIFLFDILQI